MRSASIDFVLIAALDRNHAIGRDNELPWRLPDDLKRFKALTLGKPVLMGRKTAQSLGRALPGRLNLVLTRSGQVPFEGMQPVAALEDAQGLAIENSASELCVIGGGEIYALYPQLTPAVGLAVTATFRSGYPASAGDVYSSVPQLLAAAGQIPTPRFMDFQDLEQPGRAARSSVSD